MELRRLGAALAALLVLLSLLVAAPVAFGAAPSASDGKLTPDLVQRLQAAGGAAPVPVIIRFSAPLSGVDWPALEARAGGPVQPVHRFPAIDGISARLPAPRVQALAGSAQVARVEYDAPVRTTLASSTHWYGVQQARQDLGVTGSGMAIAVVDTGIDAAHADLTGKVVGWRDLVNGLTQPYDDNGHGTHVAGIVAGTGAASGGTYTGVAPGANLVGVKVMGSTGSGSSSNVIAGMQWVIDNQKTYNIRVVNLSLSTNSSSDGKDSLSAIVNKAADSGIVPVVSAGNRGPAAYTIGSPSAAAKAVTVGSMADVDRSGFFLATYSGRGPTADGRVKPDIVAPGYLITAPKANSGTGYVTMNGTSMSSPFVAGVAALMLQANPNLTPAQVKSTLMSTAQDWGPAGADNDYGAGRLDAYAAVQAAAGAAGAGSLSLPVHQFHTGQLSGTGDRAAYDLPVADKSFPIAATLVLPGWQAAGQPDFAVEIYDPAGSLLGRSTNDARADIISRWPSTIGTFQVVVVSKAGSGSYYLDLSAGAGTAPPPPAPPSVSIADPDAGTTVADTVTVRAQVVAAAGIASVQWAVDGGSYRAMTLNTATGLWEANWDTKADANGDHVVAVRATDSAGQAGTDDNSVTVANAAPASWSSGDLETGTWSLSGPGNFTRDYGFVPPAYPTAAMTVTVRLATYKPDGSGATDNVAPYLEVWTVAGGADGHKVGTITPAGPGTYLVSTADPAVLAGVTGGTANTLRLKALSLDRKNGKLNDKVAVDAVIVDLQY